MSRCLLASHGFLAPPDFENSLCARGRLKYSMGIRCDAVSFNQEPSTCLSSLSLFSAWISSTPCGRSHGHLFSAVRKHFITCSTSLGLEYNNLDERRLRPPRSREARASSMVALICFLRTLRAEASLRFTFAIVAANTAFFRLSSSAPCSTRDVRSGQPQHVEAYRAFITFPLVESHRGSLGLLPTVITRAEGHSCRAECMRDVMSIKIQMCITFDESRTFIICFCIATYQLRSFHMMPCAPDSSRISRR